MVSTDIARSYFEKFGAQALRMIQRDHPSIGAEVGALLRPGRARVARAFYDFIHGEGRCSCGAPTAFVNFASGYKSACSPRCATTPEVLAKRRATNLLRYGAANPMQVEHFRTKQQEALLFSHGVTNPSESMVVQQAKRETMRARWGADHWMQSVKGKEKLRGAFVSRLGVENPNYASWGPDVRTVIDDAERFISVFQEVGGTTMGMAERLGVSPSTVYLAARRHGVPLNRRHSYPQQQIADYLRGILPPECRIETDVRRLITDDGRGRQIDIVVEDRKLAVEFCGLYWHSESNIPDRRYHQRKMLDCTERGFRLITIFGDEWFKSRRICEQRLAIIAGAATGRIGARNLRIAEISGGEAATFYETHHLQGARPARHHVAAFEDNTLRAVMSFSRPRRFVGGQDDENGAFELIRYASSERIPGVASRLFKHFIRTHKPKSIKSFADARWSDGGLYRNLGFTSLGLSDPGYWWVERYRDRHHRYTFARHTLESPSDRSEADIMHERGFDRIWDCGQHRFIWREA